MIKAIICDVDGVIINRDRYLSEKLAERLNLDLKTEILPFFIGIFQECLTGKKDLKEEIVPWLEKWGWKGSVDDFLKFWFDEEREIDERIINIMKNLKDRGVRLFLGTDNEKYKVEFLMGELRLAELFEKAFGSASVGVRKDNPAFFETVMDSLGEIKREEVLFIDDDEKNVKVAEDFGINAIHYEGYDKFIERLENEFSELKFQ